MSRVPAGPSRPRRNPHRRQARRTRYYLTANSLRAWLAALAGPVAAVNLRPVDQLVADADQRLREVEGKAFERRWTSDAKA